MMEGPRIGAAGGSSKPRLGKRAGSPWYCNVGCQVAWPGRLPQGLQVGTCKEPLQLQMLLLLQWLEWVSNSPAARAPCQPARQSQ